MQEDSVLGGSGVRSEMKQVLARAWWARGRGKETLSLWLSVSNDHDGGVGLGWMAGEGWRRVRSRKGLGRATWVTMGWG